MSDSSEEEPIPDDTLQHYLVCPVLWGAISIAATGNTATAAALELDNGVREALENVLYEELPPLQRLGLVEPSVKRLMMLVTATLLYHHCRNSLSGRMSTLRRQRRFPELLRLTIDAASGAWVKVLSICANVDTDAHISY